MSTERIQVNAIPDLSAYQLSWLVSHLPLKQENARGEVREQGHKKAVLRALADRYPNVWASIKDIAQRSGCSERQVQRILHELEFDDNLLTDIVPGTTVLSYRWPRTRITRTSPKAGGIGNPVQYFIRDRAIVDWFIQWALYGEGATDEEKKAAEKLMSDLGAKGDIPLDKG